MAEIIQRNVILSIQAESDRLNQSVDQAGNKMRSLESTTRQSNEKIQKSFDESGQAAEKYTEKVKELENTQKSLERENVALNDRLNDLNRTLREQTKEINNTQRGNLAKRKSIQDNIAAIKEEQFNTRELIKFNKIEQTENRKSIAVMNSKVAASRNLSKSLLTVAGSTGLLGGRLTSLIATLTATKAAMTGVTVGTKGAITALRAFSAALVATGVGALVLGLGALIAALIGTQEGLNLASDAASSFKVALTVVRDRLTLLGSGLVSLLKGEGAKALDSFRGAFQSLAGDINLAIYRTLRLNAITRKAFNDETDNIIKKQELLNDEALLREKISDFDLSKIERLKATEELEKKSLERLAIEKKEAQARLNIEKERNAITTTAKSDEARRREVELSAQILAINTQISNAGRLKNQQQRRINNEKETELKTEKEISEELEAQVGSLSAIQAALSEVNRILNSTNKESAQFSALFFEAASLTVQARKEAKFYNEELDQLVKNLEAAKNVLEPLNFFESDIQLIDAANEKLKIQQKFIDQLKRKEEDALSIDRIKENAAELLTISAALATSFAQQQTDLLDSQVRAQEQRISRFIQLAQEGNTAQLQLEEDRLAKLMALREQAAQRERALTALQITAANALAVAQAITAVTAGFKEGNLLKGVANAIALAATVGSTILAVRNATASIPAFATGTEYVERNGAPKGRDTIFAKLNEGERVLTTEQNQQLRGITNEELVNYAKLGKFMATQRLKDISGAVTSQMNIEPLISEFQMLRSDFRRLQMAVSVDEYGLHAGIGRAAKKIERRKGLRS